VSNLESHNYNRTVGKPHHGRKKANRNPAMENHLPRSNRHTRRVEKDKRIPYRSGFIVHGHGRLLAAQFLGVGQVPVDRQDYATEAEEWADLIADNRIAELSQIDDGLQASLLSELNVGDFDASLTGFNDKQIDNLLADFKTIKVQEDNFDPAAAVAEIKEPVTKPGNIWQLGRYRLMCEDATKLADVERLMDGKLAAMIFTDPPYNVAYEGGTAEKLTIQNDSMPADQFNQFLLDAFRTMFAVTEPAAPFMCASLILRAVTSADPSRTPAGCLSSAWCGPTVCP
jgi:hypothetical protein